MEPKKTLANHKKFGTKDVVFFLFFLVCIVITWMKSRYGMAIVDEAFFLSLGDKIYRGNAMLVHEWHASQFTFFLIQPLFALFHLFHQSNEGIVLFFRYAYVIVQAIVSVFMYFRLRKYSETGAGISVIVYFLFCPLLQPNFNYNSIALMCLHITLILIFTSETKRNLQLAVAGFFFAGAVLCCPALIALYLLYSVVALYRKQGKEWFFFSSGCALLAAFFFVFLLSRASFSSLIENATHVLDDPEHPSFQPFQILIYYFLSIWNMAPFAGPLYFLIIILSILFGFSPELQKKKNYLFVFSSLIVTVLIIELIVQGTKSEINSYPLNLIVFPINVLSPLCAILYEEKLTRKILTRIWIPGMLYSVCISFISNLGIYSICSAASLATTASILIVTLTAEKHLFQEATLKKFAIVCVTFLFICQIGGEIFLRLKSVYPGSDTSLSTEMIDWGCEKGIYVTSNQKNGYESRLDYTSVIRNNPTSQKSAYISYHYWIVLEDWDVHSCTPSNLLTGLHKYSEDNPNTVVINRLEQYYQLNPERIPEAVYIDAGYDDIVNWYIDQFDYVIYSKEDRGTILLLHPKDYISES